MRERDPITVLLVESETSLRRVVSASLEQLGLRVLDAADADGAQQILRSEAPQILIVEHDSPDGHNGEVIEQFRHQDSNPPNAVVVTATERLRGVWRKRYQPQAAVYKPYDVRHLARIVIALIDAEDKEAAERLMLPGVIHD